MFLYNIEITPKSYSADVDGKHYRIDTSKFKGDKVAQAIEAIRALINGKPEKKEPMPEARVIDTETPSNE